jgi:outer membrane immunogenic protein
MKARSCVAGALASFCIFGTASAADLSPAPMYTKAPPPPAMYNWGGYYAGFNVGGSWGSQNGTIFTSSDTNLSGVIGGGQIGINWQDHSPWVAGIELDIQGAGQSGNTTFGVLLTPGDTLGVKDELQWFGTVRGRFGYAFGDMGRWLAYGTFGLAYGGAKLSGSGTVGGAPFAFSQTGNPLGFTAGVGLEWAFADRWSAKLEYLFVDYTGGTPAVTLPGGVVSLTENDMIDKIVRVGANYHF